MTNADHSPVLATPVTPAASGYGHVDGLAMYYEIHDSVYDRKGDGEEHPLVLLHGALSTISTSFGKLLPTLASTRRIIAVEQQAHGHTADVDRPLSYEGMADDTVTLLRQLGINRADFFGYSMGAGVALQIAVRHPDQVRKLVLASVTYRSDGLDPAFLVGVETATPDDLSGSPYQRDYARVAPNPQAWPSLFAKVNQLDRAVQDWRDEVIAAISAPTLLITGDADLVQPEHTVALFRLLGGSRRAQLAVLPGTTHEGLVERTEWLLAMILAFLDAPILQPQPPPAAG